jgi:hypothetical protein
LKNDGTVDTNTYLTAHQSLSGYIQTSNTAVLIKNDGTIDTNTYLTSAPVTSVNGQTGAVSLTIPTVPSNETATSGGSTLSVVTTGEKYTWNNKANIWTGTQAQYTALSPNYDANTIYIIS